MSTVSIIIRRINFQRVADLIYVWENHNKRRHNQIINRQNGDQEVPGFAEVSLSIDQVPLDLLLVVDDLVVVVFVVLDVVDHHFSQILLRHFLKSRLQS